MVDLSIGILGAWLGGGIGWAWMACAAGEAKKARALAWWLVMVAGVGVGVAAFAGAGWVVWVMWAAGVTMGGAMGSRDCGRERAARWMLVAGILIPAMALGWHLAYLARMSHAFAAACERESRVMVSASNADWARKGGHEGELLRLAMTGLIEIRRGGREEESRLSRLKALEALRVKVTGKDCRLKGDANEWVELCKTFFAQSVVSQGEGDWPESAKWLAGATRAIDVGVAQTGRSWMFKDEMGQVGVQAAKVIPRLRRVEDVDVLMPGPEAGVVLGVARGLTWDQGKQAFDDARVAREMPIHNADIATRRIHGRTLNGWGTDSRIQWLGDLWCDWQVVGRDSEIGVVELLAWRRCLTVVVASGKYRLEKGKLPEGVEELARAYGVGEENTGLKEAVVTLEKKGETVVVNVRPATGMGGMMRKGKGFTKRSAAELACDFSGTGGGK